MCALTSWASAEGRSTGACQAGGVVQAGIVEGITWVIRLVARWAAEKGGAGA